MLNYTKGEWEREGLSIKVFGAGTVAITPALGDGGVFERVANGQLIASAPLLHRELKEASTIIHNAIRYAEGEYRTMLQRKLKQIEAVLAKAESNG